MKQPLFTQPRGNPLRWQFTKLPQAADAETAQGALEVRAGRKGGNGKAVQVFQAGDVENGAGVPGGQEGEPGRGGDADLRDQLLVAELPDEALRDLLEAGARKTLQKALQIERADALPSRLHIRGTAGRALEQGRGGHALVLRAAVAELERRTSGKALGGGHALADAGSARGAGELDDAGGLCPLIDHCHGLRPQTRLIPQGRLQIETGDMDGGEHGGKSEC